MHITMTGDQGAVRLASRDTTIGFKGKTLEKEVLPCAQPYIL